MNAEGLTKDKTGETVVKKKELLERTSETASKKRSVMAFAEKKVSVGVMEIKILELKGTDPMSVS